MTNENFFLPKPEALTVLAIPSSTTTIVNNSAKQFDTVQIIIANELAKTTISKKNGENRLVKLSQKDIKKVFSKKLLHKNVELNKHQTLSNVCRLRPILPKIAPRTTQAVYFVLIYILFFINVLTDCIL